MEIDSAHFVDIMAPAVRYGGILALGLQKNVVDIGKDTEVREGDSERAKKQRSAVTIADGLIQDILSIAAVGVFGSEVSIDAEEITALSSALKTSTEGKDCVIIDPIDGTLEYLEDRDNFCISAGWRHCEEIKAAIVYFPKRDLLYHSVDKSAYVTPGYLLSGMQHAGPLIPRPNHSSRIYFNRRVPKALIDRFRGLGLETVDDETDGIGPADAILQCLTGNALCYLSRERQVRDLLLGAIIASVEGGYALDWNGASLLWPPKTRLHSAIFGCSQLPEFVVDLTRQFSLPEYGSR
jgi:hypothetical protein